MITQKDMKKNLDIKQIFIMACIIAAPFLASTLYLWPIGQNLLTVMPCNSDEEFYYNQMKSVLAYGQPLGYYGYVDSHAIIGHFGAWGSAWVLPYWLVTVLTGLNYYSISLVNHILLVLCLIVAYKMSDKSVVKCIVILGLYFVPTFAYYMNSAMMEGLQFIIAVASALMLYYMSEKSELSKRVVIMITIAFCYFCACKVMWVILWVPFFYLVTRGKGIKKQVLTVLSGTVAMVFVFYTLHALTACSYFENEYFLELVVNTAKSSTVSETLQFFIVEVKYHIWLTLNAEFSPMVRDLRILMLTGGLSTLVYEVVFGIYKKKLTFAIPLVVFGGYVAGTAGAYCGGAALIRTVFPGFVFALTYMAMTNSKWLSGVLLISLTIVAVHTMVMQMSGSYDDRMWYDEKKQQEYSEMANPISEIVADTEADVWSNTILWPAPQVTRSSLLYLPSGIGINYHKEIPVDKKSIREGWIMIDSKYEADINELKENGFDVYREVNGSCLLKRK